MRRLVLPVVVIAASSVYGQDFIRIASFNIAEFGEGSHPQTRDLHSIAEMLTTAEFDLVAIQEVGVADKAFDQLLEDGWNDHYRFPLLEAVTDPTI